MRTITFTLAFLLLLVMPATAQQPALFVANQDFAPYSMMIDGRPAGIDVDVLNEAGRRAGVDFNIELKPLSQAVSMLEDGRCEAAIGLFYSQHREQYGMYMDSVPVHTSDYVLFTKVGSRLQFNGYEDLSGKIVGKVASTDLGEEFREKGATVFDTKEYTDLTAAITGLVNGEIDGFAGNIDVTYHRLKDMGMTSSIVYLPRKILADKRAYLVFSRASKHPGKLEMLGKLERALDQMIKDGTYSKIARRYLIRF